MRKIIVIIVMLIVLCACSVTVGNKPGVTSTSPQASYIQIFRQHNTNSAGTSDKDVLAFGNKLCEHLSTTGSKATVEWEVTVGEVPYALALQSIDDVTETLCPNCRPDYERYITNG